MKEQIEKYGEALDVLTAKLKKLNEYNTCSIAEEVQVCQAMRNIAEGMEKAGKAIMFCMPIGFVGNDTFPKEN